MGRLSVHQLKEWKKEQRRFAMVTAYDYSAARLVEQAGIPIILVGDSVGSVMLGYDSTVPVTMDEIVHHTKPVVRATEKTIVVADLPFGSYQVSEAEAMANAMRLLKEGGATAVKLEGGAHVAPLVRKMVDVGIPVMGHLGLTPQSVNQLGGHKVQGRTPRAAARLMMDAQALEEAGAFAVVLETIPAPVARCVTERLSIPTIGIGAGKYCDGQVQVWHDLLGIYDDRRPFKHAKRYATLGATIREALKEFAGEVEEGEFPTREHSFDVEPKVLKEASLA